MKLRPKAWLLFPLRRFCFMIEMIRNRADRHAIEVSKQNTPGAFDQFWKSSYAIRQYMEPSREELMLQVADIIAAKATDGWFLDVGCGPGHLFIFLRERTSRADPSFRMVGADYSQVAARQARQRLPDAESAVADAAHLPYKDHVFQCVACVETLEHVSDPAGVSAELQRVTAIGGTIVVTVPNGDLDTWDGHRSFFTADTLRAMFPQSRLISCQLMNEGRNILMVTQ